MKLKGLPTFSKRAIAINGGAGLAIFAGFISFMHQTFARPHFEVCTARYNRQVSMVLDRAGTPISPGEVQAVANGFDEGILENLSIAAFNGGPTKYAMGVKLAENSVEQRSGRGAAGGISLPWAPSVIEQPNAACLSYHIFLPEDFAFGSGGTLPGMFGTTENGQFGDLPNFQAQLIWHDKGAPKFFLKTLAEGDNRAATFNAYDVTIPRGRWVRVDQELVLNTPKQPDGVARLWIDGKLETEVKSVELRDTEKLAITGVVGDVYYGGSNTNGKAPRDAVVWLSPFEMRWK